VAYGGVTLVSVTSIYVGLRSGVDIIYPVEKCLGSESEFVQGLKAKLGDDLPPPSTSISSTAAGDISNGNTTNATPLEKQQPINWVREATYFGVASGLDTFVLPLKMMVCLPLARHLIKIRGRRGP